MENTSDDIQTISPPSDVQTVWKYNFDKMEVLDEKQIQQLSAFSQEDDEGLGRRIINIDNKARSPLFACGPNILFYWCDGKDFLASLRLRSSNKYSLEPRSAATIKILNNQMNVNAREWLGNPIQKGEGVKVAVLDNLYSPDPPNNYCAEYRAFGTPYLGEGAHGTYCAAIIKGHQTANIASKCELYLASIANCNTHSHIGLAIGLIWSANKKCRIASVSVLFGRTPQHPVDPILNYLVSWCWTRSLIIVCGTGNDEINNSEYYGVSHLALCDKSIVVNGFDANNIYIFQGNRNELRDVKIDFLAPGEVVTTLEEFPLTDKNDFFGISAAVPIVAGALALYCERFTSASEVIDEAIKNANNSSLPPQPYSGYGKIRPPNWK